MPDAGYNNIKRASILPVYGFCLQKKPVGLLTSNGGSNLFTFADVFD